MRDAASTFVDGDGVVARRRRRPRATSTSPPASPSSALGHRHPAPLAAAHAQLDRLWHVSNLYWTEPMPALAQRLSDRVRRRAGVLLQLRRRGDRGGAQVRAQGDRQAAASSRSSGSFHGRTTGALSVTGQPAKRAAFEPLLPGARFAQPNDVDSLDAARRRGHRPASCSSPCTARAACIPLEPAFVAGGRALADELGALLAFDEVQTGVGRTGTFFAFEQLGVPPAARHARQGRSRTACRSAACSSPTTRPAGSQPGDHASTFGGNPVACAAALRRRRRDRRRAARSRCARTARGCATASRTLPGVVEARGAGLLLGAELDRPGAAVVDAALDAGLVVPHVGRERPAPHAAARRRRADEVDHALEILEEVLGG